MGVDLYTAAQSSEGTNSPVQLLQQETYRCRLCQIRSGFRPDRMVHARRNSGKVRHDTCRHPFARLPQQYPIEKRTRADLLLEATLRPLEELRGGEQGRILHRQGGDGAVPPLARRGVRRAAVPPDTPREERALRPLPESGVRPRDGGQKVAPIPVCGK